MPNRKNTTTLVTEDKLVEAVSVRVTGQIRQDMEEKFERMQRALDKLAGPAEHVQPVAERTRKRSIEQVIPDQDPAPRPSKHPRTEGIHDNSQSSFTASDQGRPAFPLQGSYAAMQDPCSAHAQAQQDVFTSSVVNNNNNNPTWTAWLATQRPANAPASATVSRPAFDHHIPTDTRPTYDSAHYATGAIDAQVRHIMEATPHQLTGNIPSGVFPFKKVTRGPEKKKLSFNTVTLAEHMFGMFRILEDSNINPAIKPDIFQHMKEVAEDACEFEWQGYVRRWSEEVFSLMAEGRLPNGWAETAKIQNLRTGMSRVDSARLAIQKEGAISKKQASYAQTHNSEVMRGGPPCQAFNTDQGCSLPSGHVSGGKKQIHVCSYCLLNNAAAHPHSEAVCRNKQRRSTSHFH